MTLSSRSTTSAVAVLAVVAAVVLSVVVAATGKASSADATGVLEVNDVRYEFVPSACTSTDTDFVAAGTGTVGGQPFWVSASSRTVSLSVGTESEVERPSDDQIWMTSLSPLWWQADADGIEAQATMVDSRADDSPRHRATLSVVCPQRPNPDS